MSNFDAYRNKLKEFKRWHKYKNDDPNTFVNNMDDVHSNVNDDEDDAGQDEDDDNINYLKEHMNNDNDTLDDIFANNTVNDQDL